MGIAAVESAPAEQATPRRVDALRAILPEHALPAASIGGLIIAGLLTQLVTGHPIIHPLENFLAGKLVLLIAVCLGAVAAYELGRIFARPPRGKRSLAAGLRQAWHTTLAPERVLRFVVSAMLVGLLFDTHGQWKNAIPFVRGFRWDPGLAALDRTLHGGRDPWQVLQPLLGGSEMTATMDLVYMLWVPLIPVVVTWQCWQENAFARRRFLLAFTWTWIGLGVVVAYAFASAGPCYYAEVTGDVSRYALLFANLEAINRVIPLGSVEGQHVLWSLYASGHTTSYTGISAMPSLHVAMPVLYALAAWGRHRRIAVLFAAFGVLVFLASVRLGWHYALDGEIAALGVVLIWMLAGRCAGRNFAAPEPAVSSAVS